MAILKVARMGHPVLRQKARPVRKDEFRTNAIEDLVENMIETMAEYGGIGIAAPQVHESIAIAVIGFDEENERYPGMGEQGLLVLFNPVVTPLDKKTQGFWEGCLSVPGMRGLVYRPRKIRVDYQDADGEKHSLEAEGFLATVFQHELDHLAGVLYVDRVERDETGAMKIAFNEEYEKHLIPEADDEVGELKD